MPMALRSSKSPARPSRRHSTQWPASILRWPSAFMENGQVRRFVNIYLNDEDIRYLDNLKTPIKDGDELNIVPAVAGG